jgi:acetyltransferase-like isoleucine patch superfamily enzyme
VSAFTPRPLGGHPAAGAGLPRRAGAGRGKPAGQRLLPASNTPVDGWLVLRILLHVAIVRTLYWRVRYGGWCVIARGTRLRLRSGSRIVIGRGCFLFVGFVHRTPTPASLHLGKNAVLVVKGTVQLNRGTRTFVHDGAVLEIGNRTYVNDCSTITCFDSLTIGSGCSISWNTNILDTNVHELVIDGLTRPRSGPVRIGDHVWIGTGAIVLAGATIGDGAVVAAGSVVTSDVPGHTLVAGNPARPVRQEVYWVQ